jgi:hypothetical protein
LSGGALSIATVESIDCPFPTALLKVDAFKILQGSESFGVLVLLLSKCELNESKTE